LHRAVISLGFILGFLSCARTPSPGAASLMAGGPGQRSNIASFVARPLESAPRRIVSLAPSMTETIHALGALDALVGVTRFCDYPPEAKSRAVVGGFTDVSVEKVLSLRPDLIVVATGPGAHAASEALAARGLRVYWSRVDDVNDVLRTTRELAEIIHLPQEGVRISEALSADIDALTKTARAAAGRAEGRAAGGLRVLMFVGSHPLLAAGAATYLDDLLKKAGGVNVAGGVAAYPVYSEESVAAERVDLVLDLCMGGSRVSDDLVERWRRRGIRVERIHDDTFLRPSPRLVRALARLVDLLVDSPAP
jgi:ABC-type hemin transport system substrate-binding protein